MNFGDDTSVWQMHSVDRVALRLGELFEQALSTKERWSTHGITLVRIHRWAMDSVAQDWLDLFTLILTLVLTLVLTLTLGCGRYISHVRHALELSPRQLGQLSCSLCTPLRLKHLGIQMGTATGISVGKVAPVSYTHLRAHETPEHLVCRLLLEKKKNRY
eukprot:TRINITY_DN22353_c0_g1_i2.p1 TRINITY_DN22353_c0_g1~~TRINITY_DN22353_c0_g1_i2.p1  ORF type:complete len:160 (+),score=28.95 TRINITY_DN22353_c0_g1_i2:221-700(+)